MKPGKLYIKIFLHFLAFLIIAQIAIFGFFALLMGKEFRDRHHRYNGAKIRMAKELIEENAKRNPSLSIEDNHSLKRLFFRMGKVFRAMICLTAPEGSVLVKSFRKKVPERYIKRIMARDADDRDDDRFFRRKRKHRNLYMSDTLRIGNRTVALHMLFIDHIPPWPGLRIAVGLIGIGVVIAVLIIPVSRQITRPVNNLAESAGKIARGDLSARADVKGGDEIGKLGKAFNDMAEKLEKMALSGKELTAQISHELRSPLARIRIAAELLRDRKKGDEDEIEERLLDMEADIEELDVLIGKILELSKVDIKEPASASEMFSPASLLEDALKKSKPLMKGKNIDLRADFNSRLEIFGNREFFATALSNIVDNARKFSPVSGTIRAVIDQENDRLKIAISNSCPRLDKLELSKIFEPFYQINPGEQKGTGLGLAIAKKIIERHNGKISAEIKKGDIVVSIEIPARLKTRSNDGSKKRLNRSPS